MRISDWSSDVCSSDLRNKTARFGKILPTCGGDNAISRICSGERCFCSCGSNCGVIPGGGRIFSLSSGVIESTLLPIASEKVCSAGIQSKVWHSSEATKIKYIAGEHV